MSLLSYNRVCYMNYYVISASTGQDIANVLSTYFSFVYSPINPTQISEIYYFFKTR